MSTSSQRRSLHWHLCLDRYLFPEPLWQSCCTGSYCSTDPDKDPDTTTTTVAAAVAAAATARTMSTTTSSSSAASSFSSCNLSSSSSSQSTIVSSLRKHIVATPQDKPTSRPSLSRPLHHPQPSSTITALAAAASPTPMPIIIPMPFSQGHTLPFQPLPSSSATSLLSTPSSSSSSAGSAIKRTHFASPARALTALTSTTADGQHTRSNQTKSFDHKAPSCRMTLKRSGRPSHSHARQPLPPPYTVRCFSLLDFPPELFVYIMEFLSPSDMWRLCQVSRTMQITILQSLLPRQAAALNVVRTLHQESGDSSIDEGHFGRTWYERMTLGSAYSCSPLSPSSSGPSATHHPLASPTTPSLFSANPCPSLSCAPSTSTSSQLRHPSRPMMPQGGPSTTLFTTFPGRPKVQGQVQRRSDYWKTQAKRLVAIVADSRAGSHDNNNSGEDRKKTGLRRATTPRDLNLVGGSWRMAPLKTANGLHANNHANNHNRAQTHGFGVDNDLPNNSNTSASTAQGHSLLAMHSLGSSVSPPSPSTTMPTAPPPLRPTSRPLLSSPLAPHNAPTSASKEKKIMAIPRDRLRILVDMIFDPLLVALEHRRAIINCARYVSAEVDHVHKHTIDLLKQTDPNHPLLKSQESSVYLGPYLTIVPTTADEGHGVSMNGGWAALDGLGPSTTISMEGGPTIAQHEGTENRWLTHVEPPTRLRSFFQRMLWHRCLSDLIRIYNQIQERHIPLPASRGSNSTKASPLSVLSPSLCPASAVAQEKCFAHDGRTASSHHAPEAQGSADLHSLQQDATYPFCCKAHSLVFSTSLYGPLGPMAYSSSSSPALFSTSWLASSRCTLFGLRTKLKQTMTDLQRAYHQLQWTLTTFGLDRPPMDLARIVQPASRPDKLTFCNIASKEPTHSILTGAPSASVHQQRPKKTSRLEVAEEASAPRSEKSEREPSGNMGGCPLSEEELLVRRRYMIEGAVRRDNLMKQELLGLCHITCGLFTVDAAHSHGAGGSSTRRGPRHQSPTLMSMLRQGSPWRKGVWREGEWRSSAIDWTNISSDLPSHKATASSAPSSSSSRRWTPREVEAEQGEWQKICLAAIQFLIREDLAWGGNIANEELSLLKVTSHGSAWVYHE